MIGVNTNGGAMVALQTLNQTNRDMGKTQNAISTGLKVANAKDNGAIWAIANKMRSDVSAYDRVTESAQSALDADFTQLRDQVTSIIANSSFDGQNMTNGAAAINAATSLGDSNGGNVITVDGADLSLGGAITTVTGTSTVATAAAATTSLGLVNASITNLGTQIAKWGSGAKRLETHKQFVSKLQDALTNGIGAMTDADLAKESAKLQSLQVKQQLGVQALSIANGSAQTALSLFR
jgi:flagellin